MVILLARQRSGTNALRDVLDSHQEVFCLPEVFQAEPSPNAAIILRWLSPAITHRS